ncbi:DUF4271 domain-containing protein [Tenacibaculum caenipelagi]|uniref:Uncharacterized protein DUF4271 n=1 Tax=Tenacibaculum caenipelagi TaxID=1325435 RepID=A0A4R6TF76_9FLAO|nr:uncharacterized protein DUF4271 [Tenacibaculum caenipelagi]
MQAVERIINNESWITLVILAAIVLLSVMKLINSNKLWGYTTAFYTPGFFQKRVEDNPSFTSPFNLILFTYTAIVISLFTFLVLLPKSFEYNFYTFSVLFLCLLSYLLVRRMLDYFLINILGLTQILKYFLHTKLGYLHVVCLWLLPFVVLYQFTFKNPTFLISSFSILFIFRAFLILNNNKRIVIGKLFYFILYFCALEIAPLLILYKTTTT